MKHVKNMWKYKEMWGRHVEICCKYEQMGLPARSEVRVINRIIPYSPPPWDLKNSKVNPYISGNEEICGKYEETYGKYFHVSSLVKRLVPSIVIKN